MTAEAGHTRTHGLGALRLVGKSLLVVAGFSACEPAGPGPWNTAEGYRWRSLAEAEGTGVGFRAIAPNRTGIDFTNQLRPELAQENDHLLIGSGVALGDVNGDGWPDVYLSRLEGPNALYLNRGGWRFEEATEAAGVSAPNRFSTGAVMADVDGDDDLDLFVTALGGPNALFLNDGLGRFTDGTSDAGLASELGSTTATLADIDGDGDLDLYVANYKVLSAADVLLAFERDVELTVGSGPDLRIAPEYEQHFRLEPRGDVMIPVERANPDRLYLNDGSGRFVAVDLADGRFRTAEGAALTMELDDFGLTARFHDVDGDLDPDLYVCNDFDHPDHFWLNDGTGVFRSVPWPAIRTTSYASMSVDFADVDRDGNTDIFVADMLSRDRERRLQQRPLHRPLPKVPGQFDDRPQFQRNTLFMGRGDGTWAQVAEMAGVDASEWTWGSMFLDVDLDGYEDLLVANGHGRDMQNADALEEIVRMRGRMSWAEAKLVYPDLQTTNVAFRNLGDGTFEPATQTWGWGEQGDVSHGIAHADLDLDGDADVVVNRLGSPAAVFRNDSDAPRIAVRLRGAGSNTQGIGATVLLRAPGLPLQSKEITAGGLYLSSAEPLVTFAASPEAAMEIEVRWRSGRISKITGVRANRLYEVEEAGAGFDSAPEDASPSEEPLFEDVSSLLGHRHRDLPYDELGRQPLLPTLLGQLGPGLTWADVDADDDPDLLIPSGAGGALTVMLNQGGRFVRQTMLDAGSLDQTMVVPIPAGGGGVALVVGRSSYQAGRRGVPGALVGTTSSAWRPIDGLDPGESAVGPLAVADFDGDGDLDVFIGGRSLPGAFPRPATSVLLLREGDRFVKDEVNAEILTGIGMVSGATVSDLDADGDPDLLLAMDWGPLRALINEGGRLRDGNAELGLDSGIARWNAVGTGDLNEDGRPDLVATGWGRNLRYRPRAEHPLTLVHGDVDRNGWWDLLAARRGEADGELYPLDRLEWLQPALPQLRLRFPTYAAFASATVEDVLGRELAGLSSVEATTSDHVLFLSREGGYDAVALPPEAQRAPAFHAGIADLNGDGHEDVVLTQNFFATPTPRARHDAGRGLLLWGDGRGGLTPASARASGITVYGDQRGAAFADYDSDGRLDLAIAQNAAETILLHNRGGDVGLRVRLRGTRANPWGIGATVRVVYDGRRGPAREIRLGTGYWSTDDPVTVLGLAGTPRAVWVRWPDGRETETPLTEGQLEVTVERAGARP